MLVRILECHQTWPTGKKWYEFSSRAGESARGRRAQSGSPVRSAKCWFRSKRGFFIGTWWEHKQHFTLFYNKFKYYRIYHVIYIYIYYIILLNTIYINYIIYIYIIYIYISYIYISYIYIIYIYIYHIIYIYMHTYIYGVSKNGETAWPNLSTSNSMGNIVISHRNSGLQSLRQPWEVGMGQHKQTQGWFSRNSI